MGKLPYAVLLPQTQLREVVSCVLLAEMLPRLDAAQEALFDMTSQTGLQSGLVARGVM